MSNCLLYAVRCWLTDGGYVVFRRSDYGWWPHVFWSADGGALSEYVPLDPTWFRRRPFPPLLFRGYVRVIRWEDERCR